MLKELLVNELNKVFGCPEHTQCTAAKKTFMFLMVYGAIMIVTFSMAAGFTSNHFFIIGSVFSFLLIIETLILSAAFSIFTFLLLAYYGAHFSRKGWSRS